MSLTIQQLLSDAKQLAARLKDHDSAADSLVSQVQDVYKDVEAMKEYQEDIMELNELAHQRPRATLVAGIQQENKHIRELQQENKELRTALEEHQNALELIMSKYRQQIVNLVESNKISKSLAQPFDYARLLRERTDKVCEMAAVMGRAIQVDEDGYTKEEEMLTRLITENKGLRELLEISCQQGSQRRPLLSPLMEDKEVQTGSVPITNCNAVGGKESS